MHQFFSDHIIHGCDYNPDQWLQSPEILDEDIRLMKLAGINSVTLGIFSWSMLEPRENDYQFEWLDKIMDRMHENKIDVILATPSGARPAWLAQKYPEVLRTQPSGIRNEYGVRHNHCLTSPVYREKVRQINTRLAERYKDHPALKMWHVSNEYCGECHCALCQQAFRDWLRDAYGHDLDLLNHQWWNGFWSHTVTDWSQINSPKDRGENHSSAMKLCWDRFVTDSHISFFENEIKPLKEITPHIPVTTNFMRMYNGINYQKFAARLDLVSWDNYPEWGVKNDLDTAAETAFCHDTFRTMNGGKPFLMMESTPSAVNWRGVNKLPQPKLQTLTAVQAVAHGSDSVQYFQWRKSRGSHEKFHGAVVDHSGSENTRVFREIAHTGAVLQCLGAVAGSACNSRVAIVCDWENSRATSHFCGYNNQRRDYFDECIKWYRPFWEMGISADVISLADDFSAYSLIIAPFLYMLQDDTVDKIKAYVADGGSFVGTYLTGVVDRDDLCYLGGVPADELKEVFGVICEETDSIPEHLQSFAEFDGRLYRIDHICDIIHTTGAKVLGTYQSDFYKGGPCVTENRYGRGKAYYVAFRNDSGLAEDFCRRYVKESDLAPDAPIAAPKGVSVKKRGDFVFILNFSHAPQTVQTDRPYLDLLSGNELRGEIPLSENEFLILRETEPLLPSENR